MTLSRADSLPRLFLCDSRIKRNTKGLQTTEDTKKSAMKLTETPNHTSFADFLKNERKQFMRTSAEPSRETNIL